MSDFNKLDDLPEKPHSYEDVMKALAVLHKLVLKQAAAYGGKNSKYIPAHVVETSLLKSVTSSILYESDEVQKFLELAHKSTENLADYLKKNNDKEAMGMLFSILKFQGLAISASKKD